jgi:hypothetical protein
MRLPTKITVALEATGLPWCTELGGKHYKIRVAGRLAGVYPKGGHSSADNRALLNTITQIRRIAKEVKENP